MDNLLKQRLEILESAGLVTAKMNEAIIKFVESIEKDFGFELVEDNAAMLLTHFAVALTRIEAGELVKQMDDIVINELKETKGYDILPDYLKVIENHMGYKIPNEEIGYIAAHFCLLMEKEV